MLSHGQKRDQLSKIDRAFSILGLWHRGFAAGGSLRPFRLPPFVTVLDVRAIAECRVLDERKPPLLARSPAVTVTAVPMSLSARTHQPNCKMNACYDTSKRITLALSRASATLRQILSDPR